ncbi:Prd1p [Sugiyamaella lignohabitans]|uniref:Prd1p n=1 Tax=Sugiyamaella lignohabitans TaxID=796027 RepID=A0A167E484_9ASCO|nr:Prd1p [Sugiyamaella lignohabitans]ANB13623.1 Prd1p [Sugiyamaella lignohabitans]
MKTPRALLRANIRSFSLKERSASANWLGSGYYFHQKQYYRQHQILTARSSPSATRDRFVRNLSTTPYYYTGPSGTITRNINTMSAAASGTVKSASRQPPVAPLRWEITADEIKERQEALLARSKKIEDEIAAEENPTFENVILKYALNENDIINEQCILGFYHHVSADKALREASADAEEKIENYTIEAGSREDVYKSIKKVYDDLPQLTKTLDPESIRLVEKLETKFRRNGLALDKETRDKVSELRKELSSNSIKFSKQLAEETGFLLFTKEELKGVPESILERYQFQEDSGKYKVTFKYPDYLPLMKYAENDATRKTAYIGYENRVLDNKELVKKAITLRAQAAKLLGYKNHSEFVLEERMAKSPEIVNSFLQDLRNRASAKGKEEVDNLIALKNEHRSEPGVAKSSEGPHDQLYSWDHSYYNNLLLERKYQVDDEKISEYFPLNQTIDGMLDIFSVLFDLEFVPTKVDSSLLWHEDVHLFAVWRKDTNQFVGYLYLDMHPRDNKYGHAANFSLTKRFHYPDGSVNYPSTALVCNFSKPTETKPSLLKHSEVTTFFHELGHGLHDLVGDAKYARFSGTSVDWDFVEAPSQMLEFWTWNKDQLKQLSGHYTDPSKKLDDELIDSLIRSKHVNGAIATLRQLSFGIFDLSLHTSTDGDVDIAKLWNEVKEKVIGLSQGGEFTYGYSTFGHIMGGYDSGYYGYMWSEVFACDMYHSKFKADPMSPTVGAEYRDKVIGRGGSVDQTLLLEDFLGRKPNNDAFLHELGIVA